MAHVSRSFALSLFAGLVLSVSAMACGGRIDSGPGTDQNGVQGEAGSSATGPSATDPGGVNAIAISLGELDAHGGSTQWGGGFGPAGSGGDPDPSTIVLQATNAACTCQKPATPACSTRAVWAVSFEFAPDALMPGTYDVSDPSLNAFYSMSGSFGGDDGSDCFAGGGPLVQGQLVIDQVDATAVHFHLVGTNQNDSIDGLDSDGSYVAPRCN
jgi:hypothetical protein